MLGNIEETFELLFDKNNNVAYKALQELQKESEETDCVYPFIDRLSDMLDRAKRSGISVSENFTESLRKKENIVGVYKFFRCKGNEEYCFYIGKSTNIVYRLLGSSSGHIYMFLHDDFSKIVPSKIKEFLAAGYKIWVDVCEISYYDTSFSKAAHRLALTELQEIVKYQEMGQCLFQVPEGVGTYEEQFWEENYKKE